MLTGQVIAAVASADAALLLVWTGVSVALGRFARGRIVEPVTARAGRE